MPSFIQCSRACRLGGAVTERPISFECPEIGRDSMNLLRMLSPAGLSQFSERYFLDDALSTSCFYETDRLTSCPGRQQASIDGCHTSCCAVLSETDIPSAPDLSSPHQALVRVPLNPSHAPTTVLSSCHDGYGSSRSNALLNQSARESAEVSFRPR